MSCRELPQGHPGLLSQGTKKEDSVVFTTLPTYLQMSSAFTSGAEGEAAGAVCVQRPASFRTARAAVGFSVYYVSSWGGGTLFALVHL